MLLFVLKSFWWNLSHPQLCFLHHLPARAPKSCRTFWRRLLVMFNVSYILTVLFSQFGPCMGLILYQLYMDLHVYILVDPFVLNRYALLSNTIIFIFTFSLFLFHTKIQYGIQSQSLIHNGQYKFPPISLPVFSKLHSWKVWWFQLSSLEAVGWTCY